jgi:ATP-binding cassette subfamily B protein
VNARAENRWARVRAVYGYFGRDVRKRRSKLLAGTGFAVLYALARVAEPWPLKVVFDQVLFHRSAHGRWLAPFTIFGGSPYDLLAAAGLVLAATGLVRGIAYYYEDYLLSSAAQEIVYGIRSRLYRHLHALPLSFHRSRPIGDTLVRLSSDIVLLRDMLVDAIVNLGTGVILIALMLAIMLVVDPVLTAVSVLVMPLVVVLGALYGRRIRDTSRRQRKREGQVAAVMHEALSAIDVVQLHGATEREQERFHEINRRSLKQGVRAARLEARMNRGVEFALAAGTVVVLWVGTVRALHGAITPGELIVFVSYLRGAYRPLRRASKTVQRSAKALAAAERIVEVLETPPELEDAPGARLAPALEGRIEFEGVEFAYRPGEPVLHDVSFTVEAGATVAVVGATGSGKSTLVSLIPRLFDPSSGRVTIDASDVRSFTLESLRGQVSIVQQESVLFGLSIAENIRYGRPEASDEEVRAAAEAAGLDELVARLPEGYDTVLTERGASLSGGQRQLLSIARALVRSSPILVLDEPTTGLDTVSQTRVVDAVRRLIRGTTTLFVTHDMRLVREASEIVVLDRGRLVARGTYDELIARSPIFRQLAGELHDPASPRVPRVSASAPDGARVLFYSHNGVGIGHLQRQLELAKAYRARHTDSNVLVVTGSHAAATFDFPDGIDFVKLPSLVMVDRYRTWKPRDLALPTEDVIGLRSEILEETVKRFQPDLLVADFMPAGPYGELLPALDELARRGGRAIAGFRDVIDEPAFVRELWRETGVYETLREHYEAICVYGDPLMIDFPRAYGLDDPLTDRLTYCGYLGRREEVVDVPLRDRPVVLGTCGGGVDGSHLLSAFIRAAAELRPRLGGTWLAVTGPLMPASEHARLVEEGKAAGVTVLQVLPDLRSQVAVADCLVAMPGYNTVCDLLSYRCRAVLVPRDSPSREQPMRAKRLQEWGLAEVLDAGDLRVNQLGGAVERALHADKPPIAPVALTGLDRALEVFDGTSAHVKAA